MQKIGLLLLLCLAHMTSYATSLVVSGTANSANAIQVIPPFTYPAEAQLDANISAPATFLGYHLGQWHLRHDQINYYLKTLATQSNRVSIEDTGTSHEARQQLTAVISSAKNHANLDAILQERATVKAGTAQQGPLVLWLAYSIHGDEASGAHAALALAYYLTASQDTWVKTLLDNAVVLITPSQNPDGLDRFANWANNYRNATLTADENHKEHHQPWPGGRVNHYFADLNRDWLFLRHPESQGRVALFHKWQPHFLGDFHEMGHDKSYFFQPGVPERTHPLTQPANQTLTNQLAEFHRQALDTLKQPYFSRQSFDDFFYGKGSTYPDINGAIGMLFEQASARGQVQNSTNGLVSLQKAITNQFATSIASLKGALALKTQLQDYQVAFYHNANKAASNGQQLGMLLNADGDRYRRDELAKILTQHHINFSYLARELTYSGIHLSPEGSLFIPKQQPQHALVEALFDKRSKFVDATFYDISSWDLQSALGLTVIQQAKLKNEDLTSTKPAFSTPVIDQEAVAIFIDWRQSQAAAMLTQLTNQGILVKFARKGFQITSGTLNESDETFGPGTLMIPLAQDSVSPKQLREQVQILAEHYKVKIASSTTGAVKTGSDLGSADFVTIPKVTPLLVTGSGSHASEVGELWHYFDSKLAMPVTLVDTMQLPKINLQHYSHVIFADGRYEQLDDVFARKLGQFQTLGGTVIAQKGALSWLKKHHLLTTDLRDSSYYNKLFDTAELTFGDQEKLAARQSIGGAILGLTLDSSHPLSYGLPNNPLPVMKNQALGFSQNGDAFSVVAQYRDPALISGYLALEYQPSFANTPAIVVERSGQGALVALLDNLMFRNVWLGAEKMYANALFFIPAGVAREP